LACVGGPAAVRILRARFEAGMDDRMKADLCLALASTGTRSDIALLQRMMDEVPERRGWFYEAAALSLEISGSETIYPPDDPELGVRDRIVRTILHHDLRVIRRSDRFWDGATQVVWERRGTDWERRATDERPAGCPIVRCRVFISSDGQRALARAGFTFGPLDGRGFDVLLKRANGRWGIVGIAGTWVS
jgi:hypothetical protein